MRGGIRGAEVQQRNCTEQRQPAKAPYVYGVELPELSGASFAFLRLLFLIFRLHHLQAESRLQELPLGNC